MQDRRGGHYKYNGTANPIMPPTNSLSFQSEADRFITNVAGEEYDMRMRKVQSQNDKYAMRRQKNFEREEARWAALEHEQSAVGEKMSHLQATGEKCKKNQNSVSYDPITLKYHTTKAGQDLKHSDDIIKYRAAVRAKMMHTRSSGESCNIINWEPGREDKIKEPSKPVPCTSNGPIG